MFVKYINDKSEVLFIDNTGCELGQVKISGDNLKDITALSTVINVKTHIPKGVRVEEVDANPERFTLKNSMVHRNTAHDYYILNELPILMERRGYKLTSK